MCSAVSAQIGTTFTFETKVIKDPVIGVELIFLTSKPEEDSKIYQTHNQWTSDGKWLVFKSKRVERQAMAVNEESGLIVQVTEGGSRGRLCVARNTMKLYFMRGAEDNIEKKDIVEVNLEKLQYSNSTGWRYK